MEIDRLAVRGEAERPLQGARLAEQVRAALIRLLEQRGVPPGLTGVDLHEVSRLIVRTPAAATEVEVAEQLALVLYRTFARRA